MRVCFSMVLDGLRKSFDCAIGSCYSPDIEVEFVYPGSYEKVEGPCKGVCIVSSEDDEGLAPGVPPTNLVLAGQADWTEIPCALVVRDSFDTAAIAKKIGETISKYQDWGRELFDLVSKESSLQDLVDCAHHLLGNPILIYDKSFNALAFSRNDVMNDEFWLPSPAASPVEGGSFTRDDMLDFVDELKAKKALYDFPVVGKYGVTACIACESDTDMVVVSVVHKNRKVTRGDFACLRYFAKIVMLSIKTRYSKWSIAVGGYDALILDALEGRIADKAELSRRVSLLGVKLKNVYEVIVIRSRKGFLTESQVQRVHDSMEAVTTYGHTIIRNQEIISVVSYWDDHQPTDMDLVHFMRQLDAKRLVAGISERGDSLLDLRRLYEEAASAIAIGLKVYKESSAFQFELCRKYYLYECCYQRGDWELCLHPAFEKLWRRDKQSPNPLFPTMASLLKNNGRRGDTAKELYIQRNTLQYRIEKIEKLCGIDLSDDETFDHLRVSYGLYEYCHEG